MQVGILLVLMMGCLSPGLLLGQDKEPIYTPITFKGGKLTYMVQLKDLKDETVEVEFKEGGRAFISLDDLEPLSAYKVKVTFSDLNNPDHRIALGNYCEKRGLYELAWREFTEAVSLKPDLEKELSKKITDCKNEAAKNIYERAEQFMIEAKYLEADRLFTKLVETYHDIKPYYEKAKERIQEIKKIIKKQREELKKKEEEKKAKEEQPDKQIVGEQGEASKAIKKAQDLCATALNLEIEDKITQAEKAWEQAEQEVLKAQKSLRKMLTLSTTEEEIELAQKKLKQTNDMLIQIYYNLALLNVRKAAFDFKVIITYINKILIIDPGNKDAWELKKEISLILLRLRTQPPR